MSRLVKMLGVMNALPIVCGEIAVACLGERVGSRIFSQNKVASIALAIFSSAAVLAGLTLTGMVSSNVLGLGIVIYFVIRIAYEVLSPAPPQEIRPPEIAAPPVPNLNVPRDLGGVDFINIPLMDTLRIRREERGPDFRPFIFRCLQEKRTELLGSFYDALFEQLPLPEQRLGFQIYFKGFLLEWCKEGDYLEKELCPRIPILIPVEADALAREIERLTPLTDQIPIIVEMALPPILHDGNIIHSFQGRNHPIFKRYVEEQNLCMNYRGFPPECLSTGINRSMRAEAAFFQALSTINVESLIQRLQRGSDLSPPNPEAVPQ